ncbi:IS200/IS605 family transposase [uncultured Desulfovibrio sp.]|uniref:IS200/IS605 family transposase n=3 Tax=uncultured Desulfovibrio sp. TaxID=167968 RepID=UPI0026187054|nr:IS200/IS605 family transposase [uncultured Desulfovibrio sp.]
MTKNSSLIHTVWDCKYHVVWIPKYRRKVLYGKLRHYLGDVLHELARQRESRIIEGDLCIDHIHMCIAIPPKHSVSEVVGFIKGKSAIAIARDVGGKARNFVGQSFWARGYYVSIVGRDEDMIREYIRNQEAEERRLEQISLLK